MWRPLGLIGYPLQFSKPHTIKSKSIPANTVLRWVWPIPLLIGVILAPESPWWLVRQNRIEDAKASVRRLTSIDRHPDFNVDKSVALMVFTTEHEREIDAGTRYISCFQGTNLRRTLIVAGCYSCQVLSGTTLRSYAVYFFTQAGLPTDQAFNMSIVGYALGLVGVITAVCSSFWPLESSH